MSNSKSIQSIVSKHLPRFMFCSHSERKFSDGNPQAETCRIAASDDLLSRTHHRRVSGSSELGEVSRCSDELFIGGQRQIIAFVMSILKPPKLLLLDEPTAALDPTSATHLLCFAKKYAQTHKVPIILITHGPMIAKHLGDRLWMLGNGVIQREFGPEKSMMDPQDFFHPIHYEAL